MTLCFKLNFHRCVSSCFPPPLDLVFLKWTERPWRPKGGEASEYGQSLLPAEQKCSEDVVLFSFSQNSNTCTRFTKFRWCKRVWGKSKPPTPRTPTPHSSCPVPRGKLSSFHFLCLLPEMFSAPVNITWMAPSLRTQEGGHATLCPALTHRAAEISLCQLVLHKLILFNNCLAWHCPKVLHFTCLPLMVMQVIYH